MEITIRFAVPADSEALLEIYAPYVKDTAVSFETEVPSPQAFAQRIEATGRQYPYLVCLVDGGVAGYTYASKHRERAAYLYDVDSSIYVSPQYHGSGIARRLYGCLFALLKEQGYCNAYAAYTVPNEKSRRFHEKCGFNLIGTHHKTGYKFGTWHDVTWLEKTIQKHPEQPGEVKPIYELPEEFLNRVLSSYSSR